MSHQFVSLLVSLRFKLINLDWKSPKTLITDEPADSRSLTAPTPSSQLEPQPASMCVCVCVCVCLCVCLQCHAFIVWTHCCCRSKPTSSGYKTMAVAAPMDSLTSQHAAEFRAHRVHLRCPRSALLLFTYFNIWFLFFLLSLFPFPLLTQLRLISTSFLVNQDTNPDPQSDKSSITMSNKCC